MPELPEVELVRRYVQKHAVGKTILKVVVLDDGMLNGIITKQLRKALQGERIIAAERHGKQLFFPLSSGLTLLVHLGMTGDICSVPEGRELPRFTRFYLEFADGSRLVYEDMRKFGEIGLTCSTSEWIEVKGLGPDALAIEAQCFRERVSRHHHGIKSVLLDQSVLAGIGNLYADESLFQSRVHPLTPANVLSRRKLEQLHQSVHDILTLSLSLGTDFSSLPDRYLLRDRSEGAICPRCARGLSSMKVNGRTTIFCNHCQRRRGWT